MNSIRKLGICSAAMVAFSAVMLTACTPSKTVEKSYRYETDENGQRVKTTIIREVEPGASTPPPVTGANSQDPETTKIDVDANGMVTADPDGGDVEIEGNPKASGYADDSRVHVRAPMVKVDADDETGSVHIKAPFVTINKNGKGERTTIRIPGITIRGNGE